MISIDRSDCRPVSLRQATDLLLGFAHPIRLQLLALLRSGQQGVGTLVECTQLPQAVVSRHLAILRRADVVRCERVGREKIYSVADHRAQPLMELLFTDETNDKQRKEPNHDSEAHR